MSCGLFLLSVVAGSLAVVSGVGADDLRLPGRRAPDLAAILLPRHAPPGTYQLSVLDVPIETARDRLMAALAPGARANEPPGAWVVGRSELTDAFGSGGAYNPARLARLYAGRPVFALRAPILRAGRVVASLTLISPCPNGDLTRLSPGTLAILVDVDKARQGRR